MKIYKKLAEIQKDLKAPKNQYNTFGKYHYRSCEDILEGLKPILGEYSILLSDELIQIGDRYYLKATARLTNGEESIENTAFAREEEIKKGMDGSQITGTASSYARKYALNGLFAIDDTKDADTDEHKKQAAKKTYKKVAKEPKPVSELVAPCDVHEGMDLKEFRSAKTGNTFFGHVVDGEWCFGGDDWKKERKVVSEKADEVDKIANEVAEALK